MAIELHIQLILCRHTRDVLIRSITNFVGQVSLLKYHEVLFARVLTKFSRKRNDVQNILTYVLILLGLDFSLSTV